MILTWIMDDGCGLITFSSLSVMDLPNYCWFFPMLMNEFVYLSAVISYPQEIWDKKNNTFVLLCETEGAFNFVRKLSTFNNTKILRY